MVQGIEWSIWKYKALANFVKARKARRQKVKARIFFLQGSEARNSDCLRLESSDFLFYLSIKGFQNNILKKARSSDSEMEKLGARILRFRKSSRSNFWTRSSQACQSLHICHICLSLANNRDRAVRDHPTVGPPIFSWVQFITVNMLSCLSW